jgi:hypothetical protein
MNCCNANGQCTRSHDCPAREAAHGCATVHTAIADPAHPARDAIATGIEVARWLAVAAFFAALAALVVSLAPHS